MINLKYVFHPGCCGYFCLKYVIKSFKAKRRGYMSLYEMKEELIKNNYYCFCYKVKNIEDLKKECITLIRIKNSFHYVVFKRRNNDFVYLYDPLFLFLRKVKVDSFVKRWTNICLFYNRL